MTDKEKAIMDYKELCRFLIKEAVNLSDDFFEILNENAGEYPFSFSGPERVIEVHDRIREYLKYASIAYELIDTE